MSLVPLLKNEHFCGIIMLYSIFQGQAELGTSFEVAPLFGSFLLNSSSLLSYTDIELLSGSSFGRT